MNTTPELGRAVLELATDSQTFIQDLENTRKLLGGLGAAVRAQGRDLQTFQDKIEKNAAATSLFSTGVGKLGSMLAGTFTVGAAANALRSLVRWADDLDEVSQGIGVNIQQLQKWEYAWATTGSSAAAGIRAIQTMSEKLADGSADAAIKRLGLNLDAIKQMSPEDQFRAITDALAQVTDQTRFASDGADIFGKSWKSVGISVKNGMAEAAAGAKSLTDEQVKNIAALQSAWEGLALTIKVAAGTWVAALARDWKKATAGPDFSAFTGPIPNLPSIASKPLTAPTVFTPGINPYGADDLYKASDALAKHLTPAALQAAKALRELRVNDLVDYYKAAAAIEVATRDMYSAAVAAGAHVTGLPRATWGAPLPTGLSGGGSDILSADVQQALGFAQWQQFGTLNLDTKPKSGTNFGKYAQVGATVGGLLVSALGDTKAAGVIGGALSGAGTGAMVGSLFGPGPGTAIGAGVGAFVGAIAGAFKKSAAKKANEEATKAIRESQKSLMETYGSLEAVDKIGKQLGVDLAGAWGDQGQKGLANFKGLLDQFNAGLEKNQKLIAALGAMKPGERLSASVRAMITSGTLTDDARAAIGTFMSGQTTTLADAVKGYIEGGGSLEGAQGRFIFGAGTAAAGQMKAQGMSLADIATALGPTLGSVSGQTGLSNSFVDTLNQAQRPEVNAILQSAGQSKTIAASMENLGLMNKDVFGDLTAGLKESYQKLLEQGVEGSQASQMLQGNMQQTYELIKDYGYVADEATQTMLKQAEDQGLIGEAFRSTEDQLKGSIDGLISALDRNTAAQGGTASTAPSTPDVGVGGGAYPASADSKRRYHLGGLIQRAHRGLFVGPSALAADEIPLIGQSGEGMLSRLGMRTGEALLNELNAGRVPGGSDGWLPVSVVVDGDVLLRSLVKVKKARGW